MIDPNYFERMLSLSEKKAKLAGVISKLSKSKGRKYVMLSDIQSELDADDAEFEEVMSSARKANRYSNKYIFTDVDGKKAIGITAAKRSRQKRDLESQDVSISGTGSDEVGSGDVSQTGATDREGGDKPEDVSIVGKRIKEDQLWRAYKKGGWKAVEKISELPSNIQELSVSQTIEQMATEG
jgi:hypothetical protein